MSDGHRVETVFWPSAIMDRPLFEQLAVAATGGFDSLAVAPVAIVGALAQGLTIADIRDHAAELRVRCGFLDGVSRWLPEWYPTVGDAIFNTQIRKRFDIDTTEALEMAEALGIDAVVAVGAFNLGAIDRDVVVDGFGAFCRQAAAHGLRTALEFIPFWGIPELGDAWDILSAADQPGAGLVLDTWHMQRGSSDFARDLVLLGRIAGECPFDVQLADACAGTGWQALVPDIAFRGFAGDGTLAIADIMAPLVAHDSLRSIGPEVIGDAIAALAPDELGRRSGETTLAVLSSAHVARMSKHER